MGERNKREIGALQEERARTYLEGRGMVILEQNFRCKNGEIDLIGRDQGFLVFVEVKYRKNRKAGYPAEAVTAAKQQRICRTADFYRYCKRLSENTPVRYDVVALTDDAIFWYRNAFEHRY